MHPLIEPGKGFSDLKDDWRFSSRSAFTMLTSMVFILSGAVPMLSSVANNAGMTPRQAASFVMCSLLTGCVVSIIASLYYRTPFFFAASLTAIAVLNPMFKQFTLGEMVGGFIVAGIAVFIIGYLGIMGWIGEHLPLPVVLGMVAGVFISYGMDIVSSITSDPLSGCIIVGAFVLLPLVTKKIPPHIVALVAGVVCAVFIHKVELVGDSGSSGISVPVVTAPDFSGNVLLTVSLPLVIMALADIFKGYGVLKAKGYELPLNTVTAFSGIASVFSAFGLGHTVSLAGPVMAILAGDDAGDKRSRYSGTVVFCAGVLVICLFLGYLIPIITALPASILDLICGLAMTGLLTSSLHGAFSTEKYQMGALASFLIGMSGLSLFGIGAPVWAVVFGLIVTFCMERWKGKEKNKA